MAAAETDDKPGDLSQMYNSILGCPPPPAHIYYSVHKIRVELKILCVCVCVRGCGCSCLQRCKSIEQFINKSKSHGSARQHGRACESPPSEWIPICRGSGWHPTPPLFTIRYTHIWPLRSPLSNVSAVHTAQFPYGPGKWIRRWTCLTSHALAFTTFSCGGVLCVHTLQTSVSKTRVGQLVVRWCWKRNQDQSLKSCAHHFHPCLKMFFSFTFALYPSCCWLLSPSLGLSLSLHHPSFLLLFFFTPLCLFL